MDNPQDEPTRMDIRAQEDGGTLIQKWYGEWYPGQAPRESYLSEKSALEILNWLHANSDEWLALRWPLSTEAPIVGIRAFRGTGPLPVRTGKAILAFRAQLNKDADYYREKSIEPSAYNLAYFL